MRWEVISDTHGELFRSHTATPGGGGSVLSISLTSSKLPLPVPGNERCGAWGGFCLFCGAFGCAESSLLCVSFLYLR